MGDSARYGRETPAGGPIFQDAVRWVIDVAEGGSVVTTDTGGLTRWGISQRAFPAVDIGALTREDAEALYLEHYWRPIKAGALPAPVAFVTFDAVVNMGLPVGIKLLQAAAKIPADGVMGPVTVSAAKQFVPVFELVARTLEMRLRWYEDLARRYPKYLPYLHGWRMRVMRLALEVGRWRGL